jgi:hypothetical protein
MKLILEIDGTRHKLIDGNSCGACSIIDVCRNIIGRDLCRIGADFAVGDYIFIEENSKEDFVYQLQNSQNYDLLIERWCEIVYKTRSISNEASENASKCMDDATKIYFTSKEDRKAFVDKFNTALVNKVFETLLKDVKI